MTSLPFPIDGDDNYLSESDSSRDLSYASQSNDNDDNSSSESETESTQTGLLSPPPSTPTAGDAPLRLRLPSPSPSLASSITSMGTSPSILINRSRPRSRGNSFHRPNSNTRTRTPTSNRTLDNPVLGAVNRSTIHAIDNPAIEPTRPSSSSRRHRPQQTASSASLVLGAGLAIGTILPSSTLQSMSNAPSTIHERRSHQEGKSTKQGPGHRKVRRWNNDNFVGISSEVPAHIATIYAEADMNKARYTMPNYPLKYRSVFDTMLRNSEGGAKTTGDKGEMAVDWSNVRDRFVNGEVVSNPTPVLTEAARERLRKREVERYKSGEAMMEKVQRRLFNVVQQACETSNFTQSITDEFESSLVMYLSSPEDEARSKDAKDVDTHVLEEILVQKPFVTRKADNQFTLRFLFSDAQKKGAFNRLLLHALCQFHGLTISSSTTSKGYKMITITGVCKGSQFRFLDYCLLEEDLVKIEGPKSLVNSMAILQVN